VAPLVKRGTLAEYALSLALVAIVFVVLLRLLF
jgi:hypothetical protein